MNRAYFLCLSCCLVFLSLALSPSSVVIAQNTNSNSSTEKPKDTNENKNQTGKGAGIGSGVGPGRNIGGGDRNEGGGGPGGGGGGDADYSRVFTTREVTQKAIITFKAQPEYTDEARKNGIEGIVRISAVLNASGHISNIRAISSLPYGLTEKAIAATRRIQFNPAKKDGRVVSQYVTLEYRFLIIYELNDTELKTNAEITEKPQPEYTDEARKNNIQGKVILEIILSPVVNTHHIKIISGLPYGLTEKAIEAIKNIKFNPAVRKDGRVVSQKIIVEYEFKL